ncbi:hypothetical protein [Caldilinea sp.]|uniref:hypothetical protein n=1 Tax=Caldilinea sp. TaxID=2293560 RepID=UPI0026258016|nr:hypothetical protein [uncultured Caldilinea sp.]
MQNPSLPDHSSIRATALVDVAAELGRRSGVGGLTRRRTAYTALHCLAAFARKQFDFLLKGLGPGGAFEVDPRYPLAFLLEATARQTAFDIDVLLRSISHREGASSTVLMRQTLELADRLARDAIAPAVRHRLVEPTVMLTYFQKSPTIRLMPYAPIAVLGIDFSAVGDRNRLAAIAHETGHHVYRQITVNYLANLDEQIEALAAPAPQAEAERWPAWLLAWEEEIFADIYAALIAGPIAALGLHKVILTGRRDSLVEDDGDHPLDALRPQILHTTLRVMAEKGPAEQRKALLTATEALEAAWAQTLKDHGSPTEFLPVGGDAPVSLDEAGALLRSLAEEMLNGALAPLAADAGRTLWSSGAAESSTALAACEEQFAETCRSLSGSTLPELALREQNRVVAVARFPVKGEGGQRVVGEIGDPRLDELREAGLAGAALTADQWKAVFLAGDWTTQEGGSGIKPPVMRRSATRRPPYTSYRYTTSSGAASSSGATRVGGSGQSRSRAAR